MNRAARRRVKAGTQLTAKVHKLGTSGSFNWSLIEACCNEAEVVGAVLPDGSPVGILKGADVLERIIESGVSERVLSITLEVLDHDHAEALRRVLAGEEFPEYLGTMH